MATNENCSNCFKPMGSIDCQYECLKMKNDAQEILSIAHKTASAAIRKERMFLENDIAERRVTTSGLVTSNEQLEGVYQDLLTSLRKSLMSDRMNPTDYARILARGQRTQHFLKENLCRINERRRNLSNDFRIVKRYSEAQERDKHVTAELNALREENHKTIKESARKRAEQNQEIQKAIIEIVVNQDKIRKMEQAVKDSKKLQPVLTVDMSEQTGKDSEKVQTDLTADAMVQETVDQNQEPQTEIQKYLAAPFEFKLFKMPELPTWLKERNDGQNKSLELADIQQALPGRKRRKRSRASKSVNNAQLTTSTAFIDETNKPKLLKTYETSYFQEMKCKKQEKKGKYYKERNLKELVAADIKVAVLKSKTVNYQNKKFEEHKRTKKTESNKDTVTNKVVRPTVIKETMKGAEQNQIQKMEQAAEYSKKVQPAFTADALVKGAVIKKQESQTEIQKNLAAPFKFKLFKMPELPDRYKKGSDDQNRSPKLIADCQHGFPGKKRRKRSKASISVDNNAQPTIPAASVNKTKKQKLLKTHEISYFQEMETKKHQMKKKFNKEQNLSELAAVDIQFAMTRSKSKCAKKDVPLAVSKEIMKGQESQTMFTENNKENTNLRIESPRTKVSSDNNSVVKNSKKIVILENILIKEANKKVMNTLNTESKEQRNPLKPIQPSTLARIEKQEKSLNLVEKFLNSSPPIETIEINSSNQNDTAVSFVKRKHSPLGESRQIKSIAFAKIKKTTFPKPIQSDDLIVIGTPTVDGPSVPGKEPKSIAEGTNTKSAVLQRLKSPIVQKTVVAKPASSEIRGVRVKPSTDTSIELNPNTAEMPLSHISIRSSDNGNDSEPSNMLPADSLTDLLGGFDNSHKQKEMALQSDLFGSDLDFDLNFLKEPNPAGEQSSESIGSFMNTKKFWQNAKDDDDDFLGFSSHVAK